MDIRRIKEARTMNHYSVSDSEDVDPKAYIRSIIGVAVADGTLDEKERKFINLQAELVGVDPSDFWENPDTDLTFLDGLDISRPTCMLIIKDCISLAYIDGHYAESERDHVLKFATQLGLTEADVDALHQWLTDLWAIMKKGEKLFTDK